MSPGAVHAASVPRLRLAGRPHGTSLVPGLRAPTGRSHGGSRSTLFRRAGLPSLCETQEGLDSEGDELWTPRSPSHTPPAATGSAADTARGAEWRAAPPARPPPDWRERGRREGRWGHSWTRGDRAAAAPGLLPRAPDVALGTCPVLWGPAASPALTAGPQGGRRWPDGGGGRPRAGRWMAFLQPQPRAPRLATAEAAGVLGPGASAGAGMSPAGLALGREIRRLPRNTKAALRAAAQLRAKPARALDGPLSPRCPQRPARRGCPPKQIRRPVPRARGGRGRRGQKGRGWFHPSTCRKPTP